MVAVSGKRCDTFHNQLSHPFEKKVPTLGPAFHKRINSQFVKNIKLLEFNSSCLLLAR
jgi:hypothetical protein